MQEQQRTEGDHAMYWEEGMAKKAGWEEGEGGLEEVAFFGLSKYLWIHTSFSINPSLQRETTCHTVWILIFHTFPRKQKHTGVFRPFWYLERNK